MRAKHVEGQSIEAGNEVTLPRPTIVSATSAPYVPPGALSALLDASLGPHDESALTTPASMAGPAATRSTPRAVPRILRTVRAVTRSNDTRGTGQRSKYGSSS